jgi:hypothetical protein
VVNLAAYQLQISYDPSVINVAGIEGGTSVTQGMIGQSPIRALNWSFSPKGVQGTLKIVGNLWAGSSVSGSGYLAEIHFAAVGVPGQVTNIVFSSTGGFRNLLVDDQAAPITTSSLSGSSTRILNQTQGNDPIRGDANGDGLVNMGDVTKVELIVLGLTDATPGADANGDGQVNMGDVTKIELVILGMP